MNQDKVFQMRIKFLLFAIVLLFNYTPTLAQTPTAIELDIEAGVGGDPITICRGTSIQINATVTPLAPGYYYNWTNVTTGQNYNPWPVGQGGSGQGDEYTFIILTDLQQTSTIRLEVNGVRQTIEINVVDAPNPGTDGSIILCNQVGTINLFGLLQGFPDTGGTWNPPLSGGGSNFVVGTDPPGDYIYTILGNAPCPNAEAKVSVRECINLDFDNDGVPNNVDLDDDNDGILDAVENSICNDDTLTESRPAVDIDFGFGDISTTDPNVVGHNRSASWPDDGFYNVGTSTFFSTIDNFVPWFIIPDTNPNPNVDGSGDINGRYLAINVKNGGDQVIYRLENIPMQKGGEYNFRIDMVGLCDRSCNDIPMLDLALIDQNLPAGSPPIFETTSAALGVANDDIWRTLLLNFTADRSTLLTLLITNQQPQGNNGNDLGIDNIRFAQLECDFDLDEIPNYLDLDSDNDGIFDIVEAGNPNVIDANNDGIADGPVGANGVPISAGGGTNPVNSDGAEFFDFLDIDADNDGIQDNIEGQGTFTYVAPSGTDTDRNGVDDVYDMANNPVTPEDTDADGTPDYLDLNSDDDCLSDNIEAYDLNQDGVADILPVGTDTDGDGLDNNYDTVPLIPANYVTNPSDGNEVPTALPDNHNPGNDVDFRDEFEEILEEIELDFCSGLATPINLYDELILMAIPGGTWTGPSVLTGGELGTFDPVTNTAGVYTYTLPIIGNCPERKAEVTITLGVDPDTGTPGDITLCETDDAVDLFDSLGGTPNIGGEWTPPLTSGTSSFDPAVDAAGTYTYTIAFPGCSSSSDTDVIVTINTVPDAGEDSDLEVCESGAPVDLFTLIQGTPDANGTWTPPLTSGTGVFDPTTDTGGTYTYTVAGTNPCPNDEALIVVNLIDIPDAGLNSAITLCDSSDVIDIFTLLGGTPDIGGTWTPELASGTGTFDPAVDTSGIYTYTVSANGCPDDTSEVLVGVNITPNAGEDGSLEICETDNPIDLFTVLGGAPDASGTWTPPLASGIGIFDPNVDAAGTYTYTINGPASCLDDSAQVIVGIVNLPDPGEDGSVTLCNNNDAIDLFDNLGGTPDMGGIWTPPLTSGTSIFDPSIDASGSYTYTLSSSVCGEATSEATVIVNPAISAGEDGILNTCDSGIAINIFDLIGGTPNIGGTWTPPLASGTSVFDPTVDAAGTYTYTVTAIAPCIDDSSQIVVSFDNTLVVIKPSNLRQCDIGNDNVEAFDLEQQTPIIIADNLDYTVSYHISQPDADNDINPLNSPYTNIAKPQTIYSRVREITTGCVDTSINFDIELEDGIIANSDTYEVCDDNMEFDGDITNDSTVFNLTSRNLIVLGPTQAPANFSVSYYLTQDDANNGINQLPAAYQNISNTQIIFARVENTTTSCFETSEVELIVNPMPSFKIDDFYTICIDADGSQVFPLPIIDTGLTVANYSFEWYHLEGVLIAGEVNGSLSPIQIGNYNVIVTNNITGCIATSVNTMVIESSPPVLNAKQISLTFVEDNTILATASNGGNVATTSYEFKLDDGPWLVNIPNDNTYTFEDVSAGSHIITARDLNGCGETSVTVLVIDYIRYFTPNSDGFNDTWNIIGIENQPDAVIHIFNRFGKLLKQLSPTGTGWDGTYNNEILPTSDYWFTVDYKEPSSDERKEFRAHFTLKR